MQAARYADSIESLVRNNIQKTKIDMANEVIDAGRFNMATTQEERKETLEALLQASHTDFSLLSSNASLSKTLSWGCFNNPPTTSVEQTAFGPALLQQIAQVCRDT